MLDKFFILFNNFFYCCRTKEIVDGTNLKEAEVRQSLEFMHLAQEISAKKV